MGRAFQGLSFELTVKSSRRLGSFIGLFELTASVTITA